MSRTPIKQRLISVALMLVMSAGLFAASPQNARADGEEYLRITVRYCIPWVYWVDKDYNITTVDHNHDFKNTNGYYNFRMFGFELMQQYNVPAVSGEFVVQSPDGATFSLDIRDKEATSAQLSQHGTYTLLSYPMPEGFELDAATPANQDYEMNCILKVDVTMDIHHTIYIPIKEIGSAGNIVLYNKYAAWEKGDIDSPSDSQPADPPQTLTAAPTSSTVLVNGQNVSFDAYNINDNNYFKLRDLAFAINGSDKQFEVGWDGANNAISLVSGEPYTAVGGEMTGKGAGDKTPTPTTSKIYLDGNEVSFTAYNIEGNNYFKLRDIGQAFDFGVDWDGANNTIVIDTGKGYTPE